MARRVSWTNNSSGHNGTYVYRAATLDPQNLPAPVATVDPVAQGETAEWVDSEALAAGDYNYAVQDFDGEGVGALSAVEVYTAPADLATADIGDEVEGGIYTGTDTINGSQYYIITGKQDSEATGLAWKTSRTATTGTDSSTDGLANTQAMQAAGIANHPAANHCVNYAGGGHNDWHMPARSQITLIYNNLRTHPELAVNVGDGRYTLSSTQGGSTSCWMRKISDGTEGNFDKDSTFRRTRPIRRLAV